jgi:multidrug efflux pump subunit AcrA (membrane-fusion protein)
MNGISPTLDAYLFRESEPQTRLDPQTERHRRRTAGLLGLSALVSLSLLVGFGAWQHADRAAATIATLDAARATVPIVHVTAVKTEDTPIQIDLPGTTQAVHSATLDARATGYIGNRNVDIGSRVHVGDAPAIISAPELDRQLVQARAQLAQRQPALAQGSGDYVELAQADNSRTMRLVQQGWAARNRAAPTG